MTPQELHAARAVLDAVLPEVARYLPAADWQVVDGPCTPELRFAVQGAALGRLRRRAGDETDPIFGGRPWQASVQVGEITFECMSEDPIGAFFGAVERVAAFRATAGLFLWRVRYGHGLPVDPVVAELGRAVRDLLDRLPVVAELGRAVRDLLDRLPVADARVEEIEQFVRGVL